MTLPTSTLGDPPPPPPRTGLALTSLLLSLVFPLGFTLFVFRLIVDSHPALHTVSDPGLNLILNGGATALLALGLPAFSVAIGLGHIALQRTGNAQSAQGARRMARTALALGYLSLLTILGGSAFTVYWLSAHPMHLVW